MMLGGCRPWSARDEKTPALPGFFFFTPALDQAAFFIVAMSITKR
jgi:hypothetical protein